MHCGGTELQAATSVEMRSMPHGTMTIMLGNDNISYSKPGYEDRSHCLGDMNRLSVGKTHIRGSYRAERPLQLSASYSKMAVKCHTSSSSATTKQLYNTT